MRYRAGDSAPTDPSAALVVSVGVVVLFIGFGIAYAMPTFFPAVSGALAIPARHLSALFSAVGALYFLLGMVSGPIADRIGPRRVVALGLLALATGLILTSYARNELTFAAGWFLGIGLGVGLAFVPVIGAVQTSCRENPAVAGGIVASGIGAGTLVVPPLAHLMISSFGWREALQALGILAAIGIVTALPLANRNAQSDSRRDRISPVRGLPMRTAVGSGRFVVLYLAQLSISIVAFVPFAHLIALAKADGWQAGTGVGLISLIGVGGICGRIGLGFVAKLFGSCRAASLCASVMAVSMAGFALLQDRWELGSIAVLYGVGYGGATGLLGPIVGEVLGTAGICQSVGWVATSRAFGILIGPWAVGLLAFRLDSYAIPFLLCAFIAIGAMILFGVLHRLAAGRDGAAAAAPIRLSIGPQSARLGITTPR